MTNYNTAIDEMFGVFKTAWDNGSTPLVGYVPHVLWQGLEEKATPPRDKFWSRVSQRCVTSSQTTLRNGENGQRYTAKGVISVQIFCPFTTPGAISIGRNLAILVRNAYSNTQTSSGVWFRNPKIREAPPDKDWLPLTVTVDYTFDEVINNE